MSIETIFYGLSVVISYEVHLFEQTIIRMKYEFLDFILGKK